MLTSMAQLFSINLYRKSNKEIIKKEIKIGSKFDLKRKTWWAIANKSLSNGNKYPDRHPWKSNLSSVTGHHIISIASAKILKPRDSNLLDESKYDINHPKNIVILPTTPKVACELKVPLHYSSHTHSATTNHPYKYHTLTSQILKKMISLLLIKSICPNNSLDEQKEVLLNIDYVSAIILNSISNFDVILHPTGADYAEDGRGCGGVEEEKKKEKHGSKCENRNHKYGFSKEQLSTHDENRLLTIYEIHNPGIIYDVN